MNDYREPAADVEVLTTVRGERAELMTDFFRTMERKLRSHDDDYGPVAWRDADDQEEQARTLWSRFWQELDELLELPDDAPTQAFLEEAADVANILMMLADVDRIQCELDQATLDKA